jgi:hypothetical protein
MMDNTEEICKLGYERRMSMMPGWSGGTICVDCASTGEGVAWGDEGPMVTSNDRR